MACRQVLRRCLIFVSQRYLEDMKRDRTVSQGLAMKAKVDMRPSLVMTKLMKSEKTMG
jgi:hypothetical protein